jgi:transposase-like protein
MAFRRAGGVVSFVTSSRVVVSTRRYISVVCVLVCPSHKATFRMSPVDCRIIIWLCHSCRRHYRQLLQMLQKKARPASIPLTRTLKMVALTRELVLFELANA